MLDDLQLHGILEDFDIAYWNVDLLTKSISWSPHFSSLVGNPNSKKDDLEYFLDEILHEDYRYDFRKQFEELTAQSPLFRSEIRLKLENGKYRWFECRNLKNRQKKPNSVVLLFVNIHQAKRDEYTIEENFFYYRETAEMTFTGGWYHDVASQAVYWDEVTRKILSCSKDYKPRPQDKLGFYAKKHLDKAKALLTKCEKYGIPFMAELKMITQQSVEIWVRATGKPVYNQEQKIVGVRGIFQNIDEQKINEINLQNSLDIIAAQNSRLFNFGHIVSHNLRSHSSNLTLVSQLLAEAKTSKDKLDLLANIEDIAINLEKEIQQLNEVVNNQDILAKERRPVLFKDALELVITSTSSLIKRENAQIIAEFEALDEINYISEYLESILLNLITNAIRYKQKGRRPIIFIQTYKENDRCILEVSDNGMGIDLEQYGDTMFGMYKTFHNHPEAKGIGLFITKNQVEALGGTITVSSTVNIGTTFKIKF
ncbi:MAG TPA: PAS domain-containing sensor histidine kinase [Salinimicrobium sp.]|nr:PAS domain-containing sensor histidine kinase [Salinimicrobium sp.]